jgi:hypothetical protein
LTWLCKTSRYYFEKKTSEIHRLRAKSDYLPLTMPKYQQTGEIPRNTAFPGQTDANGEATTFEEKKIDVKFQMSTHNCPEQASEFHSYQKAKFGKMEPQPNQIKSDLV